ncbi:hypothetical protein [Lignipirellula cremea]|uniref:Uncharacterized protein n=1 Tax=Lignipirellula cremea TaxID=2528010 RepID=A0A518E059_9BACT|nr:hypothetical protein [Lignipirellula cremea]QDU97476.1 hypothetical protein Pla8534_53240 [Lignipirellula cremea]
MKKLLVLTAVLALSVAGCNREWSRNMLRGTCLGGSDNCCETCYGGYEGDVYGAGYDSGYGGECCSSCSGGGCSSCASGQCMGGGMDGQYMQGGVYPGQIIDGGVINGGVIDNTHPDLRPTPTPALPGPANRTPNNG